MFMFSLFIDMIIIFILGCIRLSLVALLIIIYTQTYEGITMALTAVKIDNEILADAKAYGEAESRSTAKQVAHWARIGKIAQDNPDLTYEDITEILLGMAQAKAGMTTPYKFG